VSTHPRTGHLGDIEAGLRVSRVSLIWTLVAGISAITIGIITNSLVLISFGAVGLLDAVGSGSLMVSFRHALRHDAISNRHEQMALRIVTLGMATIAIATVADSAFRLASHSTSNSVAAGVVLTGMSVLVLALLARRKHRIAARIPSHALYADGWLSAIGSLLALIALAGTALEAGFGWWWLDPLAAIGVACGAVVLAIVLIRGGGVD
jgi:divalent metal cation (Fe/Co/Zn/Cd) transporter